MTCDNLRTRISSETDQSELEKAFRQDQQVGECMNLILNSLRQLKILLIMYKLITSVKNISK